MLMTDQRTTDSAENLNAHTLRLWQLISPGLPVGAYAYSQGLETAVEMGWVKDEESVFQWINGQATHTLARLDIPVFKRLYHAWSENNVVDVSYWNNYLLSSRESQELLDEDKQLGIALSRLLRDLEIDAIDQLPDQSLAYASLFSLAAYHWHIPMQSAAQGYLWSWCENQVAAAIKLMPLGQTAGQRILSKLVETLPNAIQRGCELSDRQIGGSAYGVAIASAMHETQYTRLFRS